MALESAFAAQDVSWYVGTIDPDLDDLPVGILPNVNNGTLSALTKRAGSSLLIAMQLVWGSTTDGGGSPWYFTIPFANPRPSYPFVLPALAYDKTAGKWYSGAAYCGHISAAGPTNLVVAAYFGQNVTAAGNATPFTWATGDRLLIGNALEAFSN